MYEKWCQNNEINKIGILQFQQLDHKMYRMSNTDILSNNAYLTYLPKNQDHTENKIDYKSEKPKNQQK